MVVEVTRSRKKNFQTHEDQYLIQAYKDRVPYEVIADKLKRTTSSVVARATHLGLYKSIPGARRHPLKPPREKIIKIEKETSAMDAFAAALAGQRFEDHPAALLRSNATPVYMPPLSSCERPDGSQLCGGL